MKENAWILSDIVCVCHSDSVACPANSIDRQAPGCLFAMRLTSLACARDAQLHVPTCISKRTYEGFTRAGLIFIVVRTLKLR